MDKKLKCAYCGKVMQNVAITRRTCSNRCRQALYRQRLERKKERYKEPEANRNK